MRHLAGQVMILLFAMIAPNDSVSCILHPGSLIWPLYARRLGTREGDSGERLDDQ